MLTCEHSIRSEARTGRKPLITLTSGGDHGVSAEVWTGFEDADGNSGVLREAVGTRSDEPISHIRAETDRAARARPAVPPPTIRMSYVLLENAAASVVVLAGMLEVMRG